MKHIIIIISIIIIINIIIFIITIITIIIIIIIITIAFSVVEMKIGWVQNYSLLNKFYFTFVLSLMFIQASHL